jgi:hypothetical protein
MNIVAVARNSIVLRPHAPEVLRIRRRDPDSASEELCVTDCTETVPLTGPDGPTRSPADDLGYRTRAAIKTILAKWGNC